MKEIVNKVTSFFNNNSLGIYLTLMLVVSYILVLAFVKETFSNYLFYLVSLSLLYSPVLLFAFFRSKLESYLSHLGFTLLWIFCFLLYPFLVFYCRDIFYDDLFPANGYQHLNEDIKSFKYSFFISVNVFIIITEITILSNDHFLKWLEKNEWLKRFGVERILLGLLLAFALFLGLAGIIDITEREDLKGIFNYLYLIPRFLFLVIQIFIVLLVYYGFYYFNRYHLLPGILQKKGIVYYLFASIATILICYPIAVSVLHFLPFLQEFGMDNYDITKSFLGRDRGSFPLLVLLFSVPIIVSLQWFQQSSQIINLEKEKSETELNLLKQQINPHFFFNTLNNLYALSITKDKQTPEVILQLSELMRYVIYKGKEQLVSLKEEVKYIEDYIQLQQIRLHKNLDYKFEKNIEDDTLKIPPLLFITFVENAFKHGIEPAEKDCLLYLNLTSTNDQLIFTCKNSVDEIPDTTPGIGLENLRRRLALRFPDQHIVKIEKDQNLFKAVLKITNL